MKNIKCVTIKRIKKKYNRYYSVVAMGVAGFFCVILAAGYQPITIEKIEEMVQENEYLKQPENVEELSGKTIAEGENIENQEGLKKKELSQIQNYSLKKYTEALEREKKQNRKLMEYLPWKQDGEPIDESDVGILYQELQMMQEQWYQELYSGMTADEEKNWILSFQNAEREDIAQDHTLKEVFAMASVYASYHSDMTKEEFFDYAKQLWQEAHRTSVTEGNVYFCDGSCQGEIHTMQAQETTVTLENQEEGIVAESQEETQMQTEGADSPDAYVPEQEEGTIMVFEDVSYETAANGPANAAMQKQQWGFAVEGMEDVEEEITDIPQVSEEVLENESVAKDSQSVLEDTKESLENAEFVQNVEDVSLEENSETEEEIPCMGHQDILTEVTILELDGEEMLFSLDEISHPADSQWPGWTEETMSYVRTLCLEDWEEQYQWSDTTVNLILPGKIMSEQEIQDIISQLPEDLSQTRRQIVSFALGSVGKVPYYWGGKPTKAEYMGNEFGSLLSVKDPEGRSLKGLDCSGWVQWVYWSATGKKTLYGSTSGLIHCGESVSAEELQAGDILVRTGENAHVVMFLNWTEDGRIRCVHETGAGVDNVTVSYVLADVWDGYRKLVE